MLSGFPIARSCKTVFFCRGNGLTGQVFTNAFIDAARVVIYRYRSGRQQRIRWPAEDQKKLTLVL